MLDLKYILSNLDEVKEKTKNRNYEFDFDTLVAENSKRKDIINEVEKLKADRNAISKQVGILKKEGKDTTELQEQVKRDASKMQELDAALNTCDENIKNMLLNLPNLIDDTTPVGKDEKDNVEVRKWGQPKKFDFEPKNHWDIGADLGIIDFERGVKIAESRFNVLAGLGARLDRAISSLMLDMHREKGYIEMSVPYLVNTKSMIGTGQLPKFAEEAYICERDNLYLISTAEIPVTNLYSDEILDNKTLFGWAHAVQSIDFTTKMITKKCTVIAWEEMYEEGRYVFYKNRELAGEAGILQAILYGGIMPYDAKIAILGNGQTAKGAMRVLSGLGANVDVYNRRLEKLFIKNMTEYDILVNCILWDTSRKDRIIYREDLKRLKKGAMIIDISCDPNLEIETSHATSISDPVYMVD